MKDDYKFKKLEVFHHREGVANHKFNRMLLVRAVTSAVAARLRAVSKRGRSGDIDQKLVWTIKAAPQGHPIGAMRGGRCGARVVAPLRRPFEQGEIGPELFVAACRMGLEGLVSKHRERPYEARGCDHRVKVKKQDPSSLQPRCRPVFLGDDG